MIDEWSDDGLGFARFADDRRMRYRLARFRNATIAQRWRDLPERFDSLKLATFVMLNPSTADAFKPDRTVARCIEFSRRWGCDAIEVVNLFALISPYPEDLYAVSATRESVGASLENDVQILEGCRRSQFVIAAWGNHGRLNGRANFVIDMLERQRIDMLALRILPSGIPSHPLARGKGFIPYETPLVRFCP